MKKLSFKYIFITVIMYVLVFQNLLQTFVKPFQYFDEILALLILPVWVLTSKRQKKIEGKDFSIIVCLLAISLIGLFANYSFKYQPLNVAFSDLLLFNKFYMVYYLSKIIWNKDFIEENSDRMLKNVKFLVRILLILTVLNYLFNLWPAEIRFGIKANKLFYSHQTILVGTCVFLFSMLNLVKKNNKIKFEQISLMLILLSTLRFKGFGIMILVFFITLYVEKTKKKITLSKYAIALLAIIFVAWDQISYYYIDLEYSARNQLTIKSVEVAKDHFPIGSGFGTYGSFVSSENYSPLYYKYGLSSIQGLTPRNADFISDTFWPMILGQFGFIGLILYIIILFSSL